MILFHDSGYRCLKHFYLEKVCKPIRDKQVIIDRNLSEFYGVETIYLIKMADFIIDDIIYSLQRKQKKSPYCYIDNKDSLKKGGLLLSHIALQYHRRKRA